MYSVFIILQAVDVLGEQASSCCCLSSRHMVSANKLITVTRELTRAVAVDLREEVLYLLSDYCVLTLDVVASYLFTKLVNK